VVAGRSGGSPDAVVEGVTGHLVDGRCVPAVTEAVAALLLDRDRARAMGAAGRQWVQREWRWDVQAQRLRDLLTG
jgi:phosphatidylinositol alpha-1,6-mannosyltransferase